MTAPEGPSLVTDISVNYAEWNRICRSEFIIYQFFRIKIVHSLVFACISAKFKTFLYRFKGSADSLS